MPYCYWKTAIFARGPIIMGSKQLKSITQFMGRWQIPATLRGKLNDLDKYWKQLCLTLKYWKTHECVLSTVATDVLVLKNQAISIHSAD